MSEAVWTRARIVLRHHVNQPLVASVPISCSFQTRCDRRPGAAGAKHRHRNGLRRAATRLFLERGPAEVTLNEICAAAHVSLRTFFNYFESKEEALFAWDRQLTEEVIAAVADQPAGAPLTARFAGLWRASYPVHQRNRLAGSRRAPRHLSRAAREDRQRDEPERGSSRRRTRRVFRPSVRGSVAASARGRGHVRAARGVLQLVADLRAAGLRDLVREAFGQLEAGLPGPAQSDG